MTITIILLSNLKIYNKTNLKLPENLYEKVILFLSQKNIKVIVLFLKKFDKNILKAKTLEFFIPRSKQ